MLGHVARRIREEDIAEGPEPTLRGALYSWDEGDPLSDVLLATVGAYPAPSTDVPDYERLFTRELKADSVTLRLDEPLPANINMRLTPSRLSAEELSLEGGHRIGDPGVYVGSADSFTDLLNFWNLRAGGIELVFFDSRHRDRLTPMLESISVGLSRFRQSPGATGASLPCGA